MAGSAPTTNGSSDCATAAVPLLRPSSPSTLGPPSSSSSTRTASPHPTARRRRRALAAARTLSFATALLSALCAGSVTVFSLYGHIFQSRLRYSQFQVNGLAIGLSVALYLPVPLLGYVCDRAGPAPLAAGAALLFAGGYGTAAGLYRWAARDPAARYAGGLGAWQYPAMVAAFVAVGVATCAMYLAAVATCAKNFGRGRHRGLALAAPIAAFGLSGMWESQVGSLLLYERLPGGGRGDVDVFRFFTFLAVLLFIVGIIGTFGLRVVGEQDLIDEAVEELERSGVLEGSTLLSPGREARGYGAVESSVSPDDAGILEPSPDGGIDAGKTKEWVLNEETKRFLTDHTMWCFALGFFFIIGPGEAFINNLGTIIKTLYPPSLEFTGNQTSAATHVSIVGVTSTAARLLTGTLTDLLAPRVQTAHVQIVSSQTLQRGCFSVSRTVFWLFFAVLMSLGLVTLASGFVQNHGERFWIVSGLMGAGYGAVFSLTPIIITVIWGVENFATNWGIVAMFPALGSTVWGLVYSAIYQAAAEEGSHGLGGGDKDDIFCYGMRCYAPTFWAMAVSAWIACALVLWAWKGKNGWSQRGIVI